MFAIQTRKATNSESEAGKSYCPQCSEWIDNGRWIHQTDDDGGVIDDSFSRRTVYTGGTPADQEDGGRTCYNNVTFIDVWECPNCYTFLDELKDSDEDSQGTTDEWICGCCGYNWGAGKTDAVQCCSGLSNPQPDPELFSRAAQ